MCQESYTIEDCLSSIANFCSVSLNFGVSAHKMAVAIINELINIFSEGETLKEKISSSADAVAYGRDTRSQQK